VSDPRLCPECGAGSRVIETRPASMGTRRRRVCVECGHRWSTRETVMGAEPDCLAERAFELVSRMCRVCEHRNGT